MSQTRRNYTINWGGGSGAVPEQVWITQQLLPKIVSPLLGLRQVSSCVGELLEKYYKCVFIVIVQPQQMHKLNNNNIIVTALNVRQCLRLTYNTSGKLPTLTYSNSKRFGNRFNIAALREFASQLLSKGNSWQTSSLSSNWSRLVCVGTLLILGLGIRTRSL